jgi:shikimate dehydrogenase
VTGTGSRRFGLLGDPVRHSVSPAIYTAAFRALDLDATYELLTVSSTEVPEAVRGLAASGGGNVTLPHKERVAAIVETPSAAVRATRACNCFWLNRRAELAGDNTDVGGFLAAVDDWEPGVTLEDARVLLLGAGGAARAVLFACLERHAAGIDLYNRTPERAVGVVESLAPGNPRVRVVAVPHPEVQYNLIVNATRLGLSASDPQPIDFGQVSCRAAFDLVYAPGGTTWTRSAADLGIPAVDGLEMLLRQAALSLRRWFPEVEPPLPVMREAARAALARVDRSESCS